MAIESSNAERTDDLVATGAQRAFRFTTQFDWSGGTYTGVWETTLEGDLASSIEHQGDDVRIE